MNGGALSGTGVTELNLMGQSFNAGEVIVVRVNPFAAIVSLRIAVGGGPPAQVTTGNSITPAAYVIPATGVIAQVQAASTVGPINIDSSCLSVAQAAGLVGGSIITQPPDERSNWQRGDLHAVVYPALDDAGSPAIHVYCVDAEGNGFISMIITEDDLAGFDPLPSSNTLVKQSDDCPVSFYILTTGEYQINIGLVATGGVYEVIFSGLAMNDLYYGYFNLYEFE